MPLALLLCYNILSKQKVTCEPVRACSGGCCLTLTFNGLTMSKAGDTLVTRDTRDWLLTVHTRL